MPYVDRHRIGELAMSLLVRGDRKGRTLRELENVAAKMVGGEQRSNKSAGAPVNFKITASNAQDLVIGKLMRIVSNMNAYADLLRKKPAPAPIVPKLADNPIIADEPTTPISNIVQFPPNAPLVRANFRSAKLIDDAEFPSRYHDQTTSNWRASIQQNESINKLRAERSAQLRNASRYVG